MFGGACIGFVCIAGACPEGVMTLETSFSSSPVIFFCPGSSIRCTCTGDTCSRAAYVGSAGAVKHLGMHSQFFQNLKVGGAGLEIGVGAGLEIG